MIPPLLAPYSLYSGYVNMSVLLSYAQAQSLDIVILSLGYFLGEKKGRRGTYDKYSTYIPRKYVRTVGNDDVIVD